MITKEKARELFKKYFNIISKDDVYEDIYFREAKQCALICVDEIIKSIPTNPINYTDVNGYWQEVKKEIENL